MRDQKTGSLNLAAISGSALLNSPDKILVDPSGKYVYVGDLDIVPSCMIDQCIGATNSFRVNAATGELTIVTNHLDQPGDPQDNYFWITVAR